MTSTANRTVRARSPRQHGCVTQRHPMNICGLDDGNSLPSGPYPGRANNTIILVDNSLCLSRKPDLYRRGSGGTELGPVVSPIQNLREEVDRDQITQHQMGTNP